MEIPEHANFHDLNILHNNNPKTHRRVIRKLISTGATTIRYNSCDIELITKNNNVKFVENVLRLYREY